MSDRTITSRTAERFPILTAVAVDRNLKVDMPVLCEEANRALLYVDALESEARDASLAVQAAEASASNRLAILKRVESFLPHARACGIERHEHGHTCHSNCPTCEGKEDWLR